MRSALIATLAVTIALAACRSRPQQVYVESPEHAPVVVEHAHGTTCGHYFYNGHWYKEPEHITIIEN